MSLGACARSETGKHNRQSSSAIHQSRSQPLCFWTELDLPLPRDILGTKIAELDAANHSFAKARLLRSWTTHDIFNAMERLASNLGIERFSGRKHGAVEVSEQKVPIDRGENGKEPERDQDVTDDHEGTPRDLIQDTGAKKLTLGEDAQVGIVVVVGSDCGPAFGTKPASFLLRNQTMIAERLGSVFFDGVRNFAIPWIGLWSSLSEPAPNANGNQQAPNKNYEQFNRHRP